MKLGEISRFVMQVREIKFLIECLVKTKPGQIEFLAANETICK